MTASRDILALAHAELAARPRVRRWNVDALHISAAALVACVAVVAVKGHPRWVQNLSPTPVVVALSVLLGAVVLGGVVAGLAPGRRARWPWVLAALVSLVAVVSLGSGQGADRAPSALRCVGMEMLVATVPLVLSMRALTRFSATPLQTVATCGGALGAGLLALHLHCPNGLPGHLFLGHVVPVVVILLLVWPLRRLLGSWSYAP